MQINGGNVFRRVDQPGMRIDINSSVAGWDDHTLSASACGTTRRSPIDLEIRRPFGGDVVFRSELPAKTTNSRPSSTRRRLSRREGGTAL